MKVEITKNDTIVGLKKTANIDISVEGDKSLIDKVESAVKSIVGKEISADGKEETTRE